MANSIEYASKFLPIVDEIYKAESVTESLDTSTMAVFQVPTKLKCLRFQQPVLVHTQEQTGTRKVT